MRARWPSISDETFVHPTIFSVVYITKLAGMPTTEIWTNEDESVLMSDFSTERLELTLVGDHLCYYHQNSDTLYVRR